MEDNHANHGKHDAASSERTFPVSGMHCASCAAIISRTLKKLPGVSTASAQFATEEAVVTYNPDVISVERMNEALAPHGYSLQAAPAHALQDVQHNQPDHGSHMNHESDDVGGALVTFPIALLMFSAMLYELVEAQWQIIPPLPIPMAFYIRIQWLLASIILFGFGRRFLIALVRFFRYGSANMDTLVGLGTGAAYLYSSFILAFPKIAGAFGLPEQYFFDVTIVVTGFILLGKYLESASKQKTGEALRKLMGLQVKTAIRIRDGHQTEVPIADVAVGDMLLVKSGTAIPTDGEVISGSSSVDESVITGESMPVDRTVGDTVIGATMNMQGALTIRATKVGSDTVLSHIVEQVRKAQNSKAPIERFADAVSRIFVPAVLIISLVSFVFWFFVGPIFLPSGQSVAMAIQSAIGVLIIACPCALGLATPTAVIVSVGRGAKNGILVKDAESLERLGAVTAVVMDKTGTLTEGKPEVRLVRSLSDRISIRDILGLLFSLEQFSEHPLAKAITDKAKAEGVQAVPVTDYSATPGMGIEGIIRKKRYIAGNARFITSRKITIPDGTIRHEEEGFTPMYLASANQVLGIIFIGDAPKSEAKDAVRAMHNLGIRLIMATGDARKPAEQIAAALEIDDVRAELLPTQKSDVLNELAAKGHKTAMVGDGVNDAPALASASVGIAMSTGTDVAMSTANITLLHGDISKVSQAILLSRKTMSIVRQNLFWAFIYNVIGIPLAAGLFVPWFGVALNPVFAGAAMALSSVSVVLNSLRLQRIRL